MDQIKTYQKKDSFHKLENKKNVEQIIIEKKVIKILKDKKIKKLFNIEEKKIIDTLEAEFSNINTKNEFRFKLRANTLAEINSYDNDKDIAQQIIIIIKSGFTLRLSPFLTLSYPLKFSI